MSIEKMKKLRIIALRQQRDDLMRQLMRLGCVQVHEPTEMLSDPDVAAILRPERAGLAAARTELNQLQAALKVLGQYAPEKKKLLSARPEVSQEDFLNDQALSQDLVLAEKINQWDAKLRRLAVETSAVKSEIESLRPWEPLAVPLNGAGTKTCAVALGSALAEIDMASVVEAAESVSEAVQILLVSDDEQQHCFAVIALRWELPAVMDAIRAIGCTQVTFPELEGTASQNIHRLEQKLADMEQPKAELEANILAQSGKAADLRLSADRAAAAVARAEAAEKLSGTDNIVALEGWCTASEVPALEKALGAFDCAWEMSDPAVEEYPDVPVKLKNKTFVQPMNLVTEMYSLPAYDGVDPNPLMWPFFVLFYGIMMADMGYGLLMMIASVVALKKMKPRGGTKYLLSLLGLAGVSTFVFGALTGGFFGDLLPQAAMLINPSTSFTAMPSLFTPLDDTVAILVGSLALGIVQIFTGMIVSVVHKCQNGQGWNALFEEGAWWFLLFGVAFLVLGVGNVGGVPVVLCIGGVLLVVGQFVMKKSLVGGLTGIFGSLYNGITGYFSDILSYSRLMALMLAGSVVASVFNTLGAMTGNVVTFILIALVGNALNFALNLLGCFVHDLRLQVLEFFNRFYKDGGKPFKPLDINTNYVDVIKEEI
jgi:V/A-type H+-transporting ATPase subunit I